MAQVNVIWSLLEWQLNRIRQGPYKGLEFDPTTAKKAHLSGWTTLLLKDEAGWFERDVREKDLGDRDS